MSSQSERDAARRREILEAAQTCFLRFGYSKTSLDDIAREAGLSRPLLYRKYRNKEAIFGALYDHVFRRQLELAAAAVAGRGSKRAKLVRICELVCIEPYVLIAQAPMVDEFWAASAEVIPEVLEAHAKLWRALLAQLLDKALVEVFDLALDGQHVDKPAPAVLRARIATLIERFT